MSNQTAFETYLKKSDYHRDVMNTHRTAVALLISGLICELTPERKLQITHRLARAHHASPSVQGEYAQLTRALAELIRNEQTPNPPPCSTLRSEQHG